ncbi:MAG: hypothetical protein ACPGJV_10895 [Bacteriovoracaceae bacterium]
MDQTDIVVHSVKALKLPRLEIETNQPKKYECDLSSFKDVACFPKDQAEWDNISITAQGFNIIWGCRFEVHVLQAIDCAVSETDLKLHA